MLPAGGITIHIILYVNKTVLIYTFYCTGMCNSTYGNMLNDRIGTMFLAVSVWDQLVTENNNRIKLKKQRIVWEQVQQS